MVNALKHVFEKNRTPAVAAIGLVSALAIFGLGAAAMRRSRRQLD